MISVSIDSAYGDYLVQEIPPIHDADWNWVASCVYYTDARRVAIALAERRKEALLVDEVRDKLGHWQKEKWATHKGCESFSKTRGKP